MWWLKVQIGEDMPKVMRRSIAAFANTSAEVRAESERAFQLEFHFDVGKHQNAGDVDFQRGGFHVGAVSAPAP